MRIIYRTCLVILCVLVAAAEVARAADASEIVTAMRYPQQDGESHAHLFLYREDGKLLRQLTKEEAGQDRNPSFAPDGEAIVFTREKTGSKKEYWSVEPRGSNLRQLPAVPAWYRKTASSGNFTTLSEEVDFAASPSFEAPDHSVEVILKTSKTDEDDQADAEGHGKHYQLKDLKTGKSIELGTLSGFIGLYVPLGCMENDLGYYLFSGPLRAMFFELHLNSTDGSTVFALDLKERRLVRLSPNDADVFVLPGEPAFLTLSEVRYVPFGDGKRTSNSSYVERWDSSFHKVRYADGDKAGSCYGASMYRPGRRPSTITIRDSTWEEAADSE